MCLVSIIVPVYNVEKYLNECIKSLINQTYKDLEIILVNDGSTDESINILNYYANVDSRIKLYNIKNKGVSNARNFGIKHSNGKYLMFVDADDFVDLSFVDSMVKSISNNELAICGYINYYKNCIQNNFLNTKNFLLKDDCINSILSNNDIGGFSCNKIFVASIIKNNNILFDTNIKICEDMLFVLQYLQYVNSINYDKNLYYFYRMRKSSATLSKKYLNLLTELDAYLKIIDLKYLNFKQLQIVKYRFLKTYYKLKPYSVANFSKVSIIKEENKILSNCKLSFFDIVKFYLIKFGFHTLLKCISTAKFKYFE